MIVGDDMRRLLKVSACRWRIGSSWLLLPILEGPK